MNFSFQYFMGIVIWIDALKKKVVGGVGDLTTFIIEAESEKRNFW